MYPSPQPNSGFNGLEKNLNNGLYGSTQEKTFVGKALSEQDVLRIKELMMTEKLTRKDLMELLTLLVSNEAKMVNTGEWERYLNGKLFVWIRSFVNAQEQFFDYDDMINGDKLDLTTNTVKMLAQIQNLNNHNTKFITDIYLYLNRSTLSLGGYGFDSITKSRYEYEYSQPGMATPEQKQGMFNFKM
jgi:hypothetical protein